MGFGEQLKTYTKFMHVTQRFVAGLIDESEQTLVNWGRGTNMSGDQLGKLADATGATTDWWLGRRVLTMWGPDLLELQDALQEAAPHLEALDLVERSVKVIRFMQDRNKLCREEWFMAGVLGLSHPEFRRLMTELPDDMSSTALKRLSQFTLLHPDWLMDGDVESLTRRPKLGEYLQFVRMCAEDGIKGPELVSNYDWFLRKIVQQRFITNKGADE